MDEALRKRVRAGRLMLVGIDLPTQPVVASATMCAAIWLRCVSCAVKPAQPHRFFSSRHCPQPAERRSTPSVEHHGLLEAGRDMVMSWLRNAPASGNRWCLLSYSVATADFAPAPASRPLLKRKALVMTDAELRLIANAAIIGDSSQPVSGNNTPAANGTPRAL